MIQYKGIAVAAFHILMSSKVKALYLGVFEKIFEKFPRLRPKHIMADFELAMRSAAKEIFDEADIHGCHFHFSQALKKNLLCGKTTSYKLKFHI